MNGCTVCLAFSPTALQHPGTDILRELMIEYDPSVRGCFEKSVSLRR